jgi:hypothetical protein
MKIMTDTIYDEGNVPQYTLPDPLVNSDGTSVSTGEMWFNHRRPELLALFEHYVYGTAPDRPTQPRSEITSDNTVKFSTQAVRRQVTLYLSHQNDAPEIHLLMYLPVSSSIQPVSVFLALNFRGNHTVNADPGIHLYPQWVQNPETGEIIYHIPGETDRGSSARRWAINDILVRGYGLITAHYGDIDPDYFDNFQNGVHGYFPRDDRGGNAWGAISAWAWGLSCIMDYLETDPHIDKKRVSLMGHSRLGKTALWAGAQDDRFAAVISNESGCGGAALSRRKYGETVEAINARFPHWFCTNFSAYNDREDALPVDQHELIALVAPRPIYVASAVEDRWSDPLGEFLACKSAHPVYAFLGTSGLPTLDHPPLNHPVVGQIGYHIRQGVHDVTPYDWEQFMNFTDLHLNK